MQTPYINRLFAVIPHASCQVFSYTIISLTLATFKPPTFLSDGIGWPLQLSFVQSAFVYEMDCLDSHESVLFFSAASSESSLPAIAISHYAPLYIFHYFPGAVCSDCKQG